MIVRPRALLIVLAVAVLVYLLSSPRRKREIRGNARWVGRALAAGLIVYWLVLLVESWREG